MTPDQQRIFDQFVQEIDAMFADYLAELQTKIADAFGDDTELAAFMMRRYRAKVMATRDEKLAQLEAKFDVRRH